MNKKAITIWELMLFTLFLAVAIGASVFFFLLQSDDFKKAQQKYEWMQNINQVLDEISLELANAVIVNFPISGADKECFYQSAMNSGNLLPSKAQEGFSFSRNSLNYVFRNASTSTELSKFSRYNNPLVVNCYEGKFLRLAPDRIEISFKVTAPDNSGEIKQFRRVINLRNQ